MWNKTSSLSPYVSSLAGKAAALRRSGAWAAKKDRQNQVGVPQSQNHRISPILYWKFWWEQISAKPYQILARLWTRKCGKGSPLCIVKFAFITYSLLFQTFTSLLWHCWLGVRKSIRSEKNEWWDVGVVICLERGADCLHMVQLMPSSLALFKSRLVLPFWVPAYSGCPGKEAVKRV